MLTSLFSLFYVTGEFHRFLHRGRASNFDEFKGKDCVFVADWLKTKDLHKLCTVFEGV